MIKRFLPKLYNNFNRRLRQVMGSNDRVPVFILTTVSKILVGSRIGTRADAQRRRGGMQTVVTTSAQSV